MWSSFQLGEGALIAEALVTVPEAPPAPPATAAPVPDVRVQGANRVEPADAPPVAGNGVSHCALICVCVLICVYVFCRR